MIFLHNLLEAPEDDAGDYGLEDDENQKNKKKKKQDNEDDEMSDNDDINDKSDDDELDDMEDPEDDDELDDMEDPEDDVDYDEENLDNEESTDEDMNDTDEELNEEDPIEGDQDNTISNNDDEKKRTYILSKAFQKLYNMTDLMMTNIEKIEFENDYKISAKNYTIIQLSKLKNILYDYITITFKTKTYEQNLIFIEKYKNILKILIKTLKKVQESNS